jgi:hypothetical protein
MFYGKSLNGLLSLFPDFVQFQSIVTLGTFSVMEVSDELRLLSDQFGFFDDFRQ